MVVLLVAAGFVSLLPVFFFYGVDLAPRVSMLLTRSGPWVNASRECGELAARRAHWAARWPAQLPARGAIALTFDDMYTADWARASREIFEPAGARVTFFVTTGQMTADDAERLAALVAAGHELGHHTATHANVAKVASGEQFKAELETYLSREIGAACVALRAAQLPLPIAFAYPYGAHFDDADSALASYFSVLRGTSLLQDERLASVYTRGSLRAVPAEHPRRAKARAAARERTGANYWGDPPVDDSTQALARAAAEGRRGVYLTGAMLDAEAMDGPAARAALGSLLDEIARNGTMAVFFGHRIRSKDEPPDTRLFVERETLAWLVQMARALGIEFVTVSELVRPSDRPGPG